MITINEQIVEKFENVGFWGTEKHEDYYEFVAKCVMERICGFKTSHTVSAICKEVGFLTASGNTTKLGRGFAYSYYVRGWRGDE